MGILSRRREKLVATAALVALLAPLALSMWAPDLAGWQAGHGHVSSSAVVLDHDHPYDDHDHSEESTDHDAPSAAGGDSSVVFTFADDGPLGSAVHPPVPAIVSMPGIERGTEPQYLHEYAPPAAIVPVPPPRA